MHVQWKQAGTHTCTQHASQPRPARTRRRVPTSATQQQQPQRDIRTDLWSTLLEAGARVAQKQLADSVDVVSQMARRVQRLVLPPPTGFPPGPQGDSAVALISAPLDFLERTKQAHGTIVGLLLGGERVVLASDPDAAKQVLMEKAYVFGKEGTAFFPGSSLTGNGLLVSDGEVHKRQRRLSNPAFRRAAVEAYAAAMVSASQRLLDSRWQQPGEVRDVYADFNELTLEITLEALFGIDASSDSDSLGASTDAAEIVDAVAMAFEFFTRRAGGIPIPESIPTWDNLQFASAVVRLDRVVYGLISDRRNELAAKGEAGVEERKDLLNALLVSKDDDGQGMSDEALRSELMTLLVAGQETSGILLGWATALLAHNPEKQERAAAEVAAVLQGRTPEAADVRALPYIESVVLESLRLYSPAYMVGRCAQQDTDLCGWSLQAGTTVLVSPYLLHREPAAWGPDADQFRPERWQQWQESAGGGGFMALLSGLGPNGSYVPFGGGPRNCIGTYFAMQEAILVLATVLQRHHLSPGTSAFPAAKPLITLRPEAVRLRIMPRKGGSL